MKVSAPFAAALALAASACAEGEAGAAEASTAAAAPASRDVAGAAWNVDPANSRLGFSATQNGEVFEGVFERFDAAIVFDPDNLADASIDVTIDMGSAKTGDRQRDSALPGSDWFKVKDYPTARFASSDIAESGPGAYSAAGTLTIRDVTKDVVLPFTLAIDGDRATAEGAVSLVRTDFGVGRGEFADGKWVGVDVEVSVSIEATR